MVAGNGRDITFTSPRFILFSAFLVYFRGPKKKIMLHFFLFFHFCMEKRVWQFVVIIIK